VDPFVVPALFKAVIAGLAKELDSDARCPAKLAAEVKPECHFYQALR
jgi:hypothetical protein